MREDERLINGCSGFYIACGFLAELAVRCIVGNVPRPGLNLKYCKLPLLGSLVEKTGQFLEVVGNQIPISRTFVPTANSVSRLPVSGWLLGVV